MAAFYASFVVDVTPRREEAERLRIELETTHKIAVRLNYMQDVTVLMVGGKLAVWGYGRRWRWWTGRTGSRGKWIYDHAFTTDVRLAAHLIAARHTELIATQPQAAGRR